MSDAAIVAQRPLDHSKKFNFIYAVELPFWVSIESGKYGFPNGNQLNLRNDLWLLTKGNIVDDPPDEISFIILNEKQVENPDLLSHLIGESSHYHKRKMKTTFSRSREIIPFKGAITAKPGTEEWTSQPEKVAMSAIPFEEYQEMLDNINSFLDYYVAIISPALTFGEVRRVSFYDVLFRILFNAKAGKTIYLHSIPFTPDIRIADIPYPPFRVTVRGQSQQFREAIHIVDAPAFHQIQWSQTLNHIREGRPQEALLSCAIVLEALVYSYWNRKHIRRIQKERGTRGLASWLRNLGHSKLQKEFDAAAGLWSLRNKVVHGQPKLTESDFDTIRNGIGALQLLRPFFLRKIGPDILKVEKEFSSFLEATHLIAARPSVKRSVPIAIQWRREMDHYEEYKGRRI